MCRDRKLVSAFGAVFLKVGEKPLVGQIEFTRIFPIPVRYLNKALYNMAGRSFDCQLSSGVEAARG